MVKRQTESAVLRKFVLCDDALSGVETPRAHPAFQRHFLQRRVRRQPFLQTERGPGMNRLNPDRRLFFRLMNRLIT